MTCVTNDTFRLDPTSRPITAASASFVNLCTATKIVDRLHKDFTEKYVATTTAGSTVISDTLKVNPSFHLRRQPTLGVFNSETAGTNIDRFYKEFTTNSASDDTYKGVVSAILKGEYDTVAATYKTYPPAISSATDFTSPATFKGIYGLHKVTELLEGDIRKKIVSTTLNFSDKNSDNIRDFNNYQKRQGIKTTIEEIAHRENQIYREKFLNIILILVGIFIVGTQLVNKYFSFGDGGGGGGGGGGFGFGGVGGWLSTRFGSGSSGLFSRFGGIGLGSSGRSRIGNLFTRSPYASSTR
jgi:hypothetical protein